MSIIRRYNFVLDSIVIYTTLLLVAYRVHQR